MQNSRDSALAVGMALAEHRGGAVTVLDLGPCQAWTDFFVLATATSSTHLRGLANAVDGWARAEGLHLFNVPRIADDEGWVLMDYGDIVIHLMTATARAFYELEKLWFQAIPTLVEAPQPRLPPEALA